MTTITRPRLTTAAAAFLAALLAGATACGTENGTSASPIATSPGVKAGRTSGELREAAQAKYDAYLPNSAEQRAEQKRAERADALRWGHGQLAHHTRR